MAAAGNKEGICKDCKSDFGTWQCTEGCGLLCNDCDSAAHKDKSKTAHRRLPRVFNATMAAEAEAQRAAEEKKKQDAITSAAAAATKPAATTAGPVVLKSGYLTKEGRIVKSWKKRWFVLQPNFLQYYTDDKKSSMQGDMKLDDGAVTRLPVEKPLGRGKAHCLSIDVKGRTLYLAAASEAEQNEWATAIARAAPNGTLDGLAPPAHPVTT